MSYQKPVVRSMDEVVGAEVENSRGASMKVLLGPEQGAPNFITRCFTLQPGARVPAHQHDNIEHEQVMLEGEMVLGLDNEARVVREGDVIFIPARLPHWYENRSAGVVRFLCVVPHTQSYQTEWLEPPER